MNNPQTMAMEVSELFDIRTSLILERRGIKTVGDLVACVEKERKATEDREPPTNGIYYYRDPREFDLKRLLRDLDLKQGHVRTLAKNGVFLGMSPEQRAAKACPMCHRVIGSGLMARFEPLCVSCTNKLIKAPQSKDFLRVALDACIEAGVFEESTEEDTKKAGFIKKRNTEEDKRLKMFMRFLTKPLPLDSSIRDLNFLDLLDKDSWKMASQKEKSSISRHTHTLRRELWRMASRIRKYDEFDLVKLSDILKVDESHLEDLCSGNSRLFSMRLFLALLEHSEVAVQPSWIAFAKEKYNSW